jgi:hypothetical protein
MIDILTSMVGLYARIRTDSSFNLHVFFLVNIINPVLNQRKEITKYFIHTK